MNEVLTNAIALGTWAVIIMAFYAILKRKVKKGVQEEVAKASTAAAQGPLYNVYRQTAEGNKRVIASRLSLEEAQRHLESIQLSYQYAEEAIYRMNLQANKMRLDIEAQGVPPHAFYIALRTED